MVSPLVNGGCPKVERPLRRVPGTTALIAACALVLTACSEDPPLGNVEPEPVALNARQFVKSPVIGRAGALAATDRYLWIADGGGDPFVHLADLETGSVLRSFGRRGDGPGEYQSLRPIFVDDEVADAVVAYDGTLRRLTRLVAVSGGQINVDRTTSLAALTPIPRRIGAVAGGYVGWLADSATRWLTLDTDGQPVRQWNGPLVGPEQVGWRQRVNASNNLSICGRPNSSRFAVVYGSAGRIELHDLVAGLIRLAAVPDSSNGDFEAVEGFGGELRWNRLRYFYADCEATDRFLFALYSGKPEGKPEEMNWGGSSVQVFDWEGHLISLLLSPIDLAAIAIDRSGRLLFGSSVDGSAVYRFDLPTELQGRGLQ